jgi:Spy/CpxP family protein refolding chaperone
MTKLTKVLVALLAALSVSSLAVAAQSGDEETSEQFFYKHTGGVPPQ